MAQTLTPPTETAVTTPDHLSPVLARYFQTRWARGVGHRLYDSDGRAYLDFACGIATTVLGHGHPKVNAAIHGQVDTLLHICNGLGYVEPVSALAASIAEVMPAPLDTVFFGNSGSEAIEGAVKLARRATGRTAVIAFTGGFHGRTYAAMTATSSNINYRFGHAPLVPDIHVAPFPNVYRDFDGDEERAARESLASLRLMLTTEVPPQTVAAFLIEPVQGEGGYYPAPAAFLRGLRALADEIGALLILDEVQCGYGRTGRMWAFAHAGVIPDVVTLAKAIANGLPLGAVVSSHELQARWGLGAHGSTFGGNPVACAAGVAVIDAIRTDGLVANAATRGAELIAGLRELAALDERIGDVRGLGLMLAVELVKDRATREPDGGLADRLLERCLERGLVLLTCGPAHASVRWIPPLDVTADEIGEALGIFREALAATR